jgi:hypothetical protein
MSSTRDPFEYVGWCVGPSVNIDPVVDFPLCTDIGYVNPTLDIFRIDMTIPDLAPPPMCPCIWSFDSDSPGQSSVNVTGISKDSASGRIVVRPRNADEQDCCNPSFDIDFKIDMPCIPFGLSFSGTATGGVFSLGGSIDLENCNLVLRYKASFPNVSVTCIGFSVTNVIEPLNVGELNLALVADIPNCLLKMSAKISLPEAEETVIVSIRLDETNGFQVYKKTVRIYEVVSDDGWSTIIGVGSCTT